MTYYGAQKIITNHNVMAAPPRRALGGFGPLPSSISGAKDVRITAISAGPIKMLASPGISDFAQIQSH